MKATLDDPLSWLLSLTLLKGMVARIKRGNSSTNFKLTPHVELVGKMALA